MQAIEIVERDPKIGAYLDYLTYERQLCESSSETYVYLLSKFTEFVGKDLNEIDKDDIRDFIKYLKCRELRSATLTSYISSLRSFYNYQTNLTGDRRISDISFFLNKVIRVRTERTVAEVPTSDEIEKIRSAMQEKKITTLNQPNRYRTLLRDIAALEMLIATGARSSEIRGIRGSDLDFDSNTVFIKKGKGGHQRISLFSDTAAKCVRQYMEYAGIRPYDVLFPMAQGNLLNYIVKRWSKLAGVNAKLHPHSFRHYHITEKQRRGASQQAVADQVGHSSIVSTRRYTHLDLPYRREQYGKSDL